MQNSLFFLSSVLFSFFSFVYPYAKKDSLLINAVRRKNCIKFVLLAIQAIIFVCTHVSTHTHVHRILRSSIQLNYQKEAKADQLFSS